MSQKWDYWREMTAGTCTPELAAEVVDAIQRYGIPELLWVKDTHFTD